MPPEQEGRITPPGAGNNGNVPPPAYRWKKGQSGNPGGRPKNESLLSILRRKLQEEHNGKTLAEIVVEALLKGAVQGKPEHLKELLNRVEGKVTDKHELTGAEGGPVRVAYKVVEGECWKDA